MNHNKKQFNVLKNNEGQYSIWPEDKKVPQGWIKEKTFMSKNECLMYVNQVWTDMRPLSLIKWSENQDNL